MAKKKPTEIPALRQKRFESGNPDLVMTNAIPRDTEYDLSPAPTRTRIWGSDEFSYRVSKPGNCVREDGRE